MLNRLKKALGLVGQPSLEARAAAIFANGGYLVYDPSDISKLSQDTAGATPVTATGQTVGGILDQLGLNLRLTQASSASRPVFQQDADGKYYLGGDGIDDGLFIASVDMSATDKVTVWAGIYKGSDAAAACVVEFSPSSSTNNGSFGLLAPGSAAANFVFRSRGTASATTTSDNSFPASNKYVISGTGSIGNDISLLRVRSTVVKESVADQGTGNLGAYGLYVMRRNNASLPFMGRLYFLAIKMGEASPYEISTITAYANSKTGAS